MIDAVSSSSIYVVFSQCATAIQDGQLVYRSSRRDKEYHFQDWISARLAETRLNYELGSRNSYPDFRMVQYAEGYEVKGLAYPGREHTFDANSQSPTGTHNGRTIFYVFGRYPGVPDGDRYPVLDLVMCHGDFLNADHDYRHKNRSAKCFGSYGDIMIRDRKMYVIPTPFALAIGLAHTQTLILPAEFPRPTRLKQVGTLHRTEAEMILVSYTFNLTNNILSAETIPNPSAGKEHVFEAWRLHGGSDEPVSMV